MAFPVTRAAEYLSPAVQKKRLREIKERIRLATPRQVVRAEKVKDGFATCVCGNKIKLELDGPILKYGKREFLPVLVGVICRKCNREVRLDDERIKISATLRKGLRGTADAQKRSGHTPDKRAH